MSSTGTAAVSTGIFSTLENYFETAWTEVKADAVELWDETETTVVSDLEALWSFAAPIAINAVMAQVSSVASGTEKFGTAVTTVVQAVEAAGKPIVIADGQALVQNAYNFVQSKVSGTTQAPATGS